MLVPVPATAAEVPDLLPTIAVTDDVAAVELAMKVAAVANLPFSVDFDAGATTEPFDAASATDVPSATGKPLASTMFTFTDVPAAETVTLSTESEQ